MPQLPELCFAIALLILRGLQVSQAWSLAVCQKYFVIIVVALKMPVVNLWMRQVVGIMLLQIELNS